MDNNENKIMLETPAQVTPEAVIPEQESPKQDTPVAVQTTEDKSVKETETVAVSESQNKKELEAKNDNDNIIFAKLKEIKEANGTIEVEVLAKIRGGLRVSYEGMQMFLPSGHFSMKRTTSDSELDSAVSQKFKVSILDLQQDDTGRKTIIVTRRDVLESEFWGNIKLGDKIKGKVISTPDFGVFIDLGGIDGLIHISKLSKSRVSDTSSFTKVGEELEAIVIELNRENKKVSLSLQELEASPWDDLDTEKYKEGEKITGKIRKILDFGAFVELEPGIDGLLKVQEISWTRRIHNPKTILKNGEDIELIIKKVDLKKRQIALSLKAMQENPWNTMTEKYQIKSEYKGIVSAIVEQGAVLTLDNEVDAFMPLSRMRPLLVDDKIPFKRGEELDVVIIDIDSAKGSMIIAPKLTEEQMQEARNFKPSNRREGSSFRDKRRDSSSNTKINPSSKAKAGGSSFSIGDLLSDAMKKSLME